MFLKNRRVDTRSSHRWSRCRSLRSRSLVSHLSEITRSLGWCYLYGRGRRIPRLFFAHSQAPDPQGDVGGKFQLGVQRCSECRIVRFTPRRPRLNRYRVLKGRKNGHIYPDYEMSRANGNVG